MVRGFDDESGRVRPLWTARHAAPGEGARTGAPSDGGARRGRGDLAEPERLGGLVGSPAYARFGGLRKPRRKVLGSDIAGVVAAIGPGVTRFAVGDEVYGDNLQRLGGFAEFAIASEAVLAIKPAALTFVQASTIPQAGAIALQGTAMRSRARGC